jgi:hypothetical protein
MVLFSGFMILVTTTLVAFSLYLPYKSTFHLAYLLLLEISNFYLPSSLPLTLLSSYTITGISSVEFAEDLTISSMTSPEGECVPFLTPIDPKNKNIEVWMVEVKEAMISKKRSCLYSIVLSSFIPAKRDSISRYSTELTC